MSDPHWNAQIGRPTIAIPELTWYGLDFDIEQRVFSSAVVSQR
jgi:hypothetical protein